MNVVNAVFVDVMVVGAPDSSMANMVVYLLADVIKLVKPSNGSNSRV